MLNESLLHSPIYLEDDIYNTQIHNNSSSFTDTFNAIKKIDRLPLKGFDIHFSDSNWDFSSIINKEVSVASDNEYTLNFEGTPNEFMDVTKFFIYDCLCDTKTAIPRTDRTLREVKEFLRYLKDNYITSLDLLTEDIMKDYISSLKSAKLSNKASLAPRTILEKRTCVRKLLEFYCSKMNELDYSSQIKVLRLTKAESQEMNTHIEHSKKPDIPKQYFNELMSTLIKVMNDTSKSNDERADACIFIIASQTGLRGSELVLLKTGTVESVEILNGSKTAYFMNYISPKAGQRGIDNSYHEGKTAINDISKSAYDTLVEIYHEKRETEKTNFLYCPGKVSLLPKKEGWLNSRLKTFLLTYRNEINCINVSNQYPELYNSSCVGGTDGRIKGVAKSITRTLKDDDVFSYITVHQFRVHVCTELYYKKVPLDVIAFYMSHLSEDMSDYYVRRPERTEEENHIVDSILTDILKNDVIPIGSQSDALKKRIDEFITENNFDVEKDLETIISTLKKRIPIKLKNGGICMKSGAKRPCSMDADTDEFYCASDVCPNNFRLYWHLDTTYGEFQDFLKTITHNKKNGFIRQAQHEERKLRFIVSDRLIPELEQLKQQLQRKGSDYITNEHPYLEQFIEDYDNIYKEVSQWKQ